MDHIELSKADKRWLRWMRVGHRLGCHQLPQRSFFFHGYQFPVCARCTGVVISFPLALILLAKKKLSRRACVCMSGVMFVDWALQRLKIKESTNPRRLVTGFIGGLGFNYLYHDLFIAGIRKLHELYKKG